MSSSVADSYKYIIVGGGIAGVSCAEMLSSLTSHDAVLLVTASPLIKAVTNYRKVTKILEDFDVEEKPMFDLSQRCPNVTVVHGKVARLCTRDKEVYLTDGKSFKYDKLCVCSGGLPKLIAKDNPFVLGIRDTETVKVFQRRLHKARRIVVVGNGGIATELVYEVEGCDVVWAIKDASITSTFIDAGAAQFFLPSINDDKTQSEGSAKKRTKYKVDDDVTTTISRVSPEDLTGGALGPDWHDGLNMRGATKDSHNVRVVYKVEVAELLTPDQLVTSGRSPSAMSGGAGSQAADETWPVYVRLTNDEVYGCDFIISATGVVPNVQPFLDGNKFEMSDDHALCVDTQMRTSEPHVYAAGDVCHADWGDRRGPGGAGEGAAGWADTPGYWVQMRLWSQARQTGAYAAQAMVAHSCGDSVMLDFCFEMFAHVTRFFNYKVILLGKFNAQGLEKDYNLLLRVTKGKEYVKVVLRDGRMHGALLIGDTDLEETFENLILNQMDLSAFGEDLLNPDIDIEDFFD